MTENERALAVSYSDMIQVKNLIEHILRVDGDALLSNEAMNKLAEAQLLLEQVYSEYSKLVAQATDFGGKELHGHNEGSCGRGQGGGEAI